MTTRAQQYGVKPAKLAAQSARRIAKVKKLLIEIAGLYGDVYADVVRSVDASIAELEKSIADATEYLNEELDDDGPF